MTRDERTGLYTVTKAELTTWAFAHEKQLNEMPFGFEVIERDDETHGLIDDGFEPTNTPHLCHWATTGSATETFRSYMEHTLQFVERTADDPGEWTYTFNPLKLHYVHAIADLVGNEYDQLGFNNNVHDTIWRAFDLSGDDDTDYNGGHVMAIIELLTEYCKQHGVKTA